MSWIAVLAIGANAASPPAAPQSLETGVSPPFDQLPQSLNTSTEATIKLRCDGDQYGKGLNFNDCKQAFESIARSGQQTSFGERGTTEQRDITVPYRFSSGISLLMVDRALRRFQLISSYR